MPGQSNNIASSSKRMRVSPPRAPFLAALHRKRKADNMIAPEDDLSDASLYDISDSESESEDEGQRRRKEGGGDRSRQSDVVLKDMLDESLLKIYNGTDTHPTPRPAKKIESPSYSAHHKDYKTLLTKFSKYDKNELNKRETVDLLNDSRKSSGRSISGLSTAADTINTVVGLAGKQIKGLEQRVDTLELRVKSLEKLRRDDRRGSRVFRLKLNRHRLEKRSACAEKSDEKALSDKKKMDEAVEALRIREEALKKGEKELERSNEALKKKLKEAEEVKKGWEELVKGGGSAVQDGDREANLLQREAAAQKVLDEAAIEKEVLVLREADVKAREAAMAHKEAREIEYRRQPEDWRVAASMAMFEGIDNELQKFRAAKPA